MRLSIEEYRKLTGSEPPKAKRKKGKKSVFAAGPRMETFPPGTVLAEGFIPGRPVPWKMADIGAKPSRDYLAFKGWQGLIRTLTTVDCRVSCPHAGAVVLDAVFYLRPVGKRRPPDKDNLIKAFSDALQGVVIDNDWRVVAGDVRRLEVADEWGEGAAYRVVACELADEPEWSRSLRGRMASSWA